MSPFAADVQERVDTLRTRARSKGVRLKATHRLQADGSLRVLVTWSSPRVLSVQDVGAAVVPTIRRLNRLVLRKPTHYEYAPKDGRHYGNAIFDLHPQAGGIEPGFDE